MWCNDCRIGCLFSSSRTVAKSVVWQAIQCVAERRQSKAVNSRRQSKAVKFVGLLLRPHDRSIPGRDSILRISRSTGRASGIFRDFPGRPFSAKKKISERFPRRFIRTGRWLFRDFQRFPEIFRDFQRFSEIFRDFPGGCFSRLQKSLADGGGWGQE